MYNFTISEVLDQAWALTKKHGLLLALILLVISLVESAFTRVDQTQLQYLMETYKDQLNSGDPEQLLPLYNQFLSQTVFSGGSLLGLLLSVVLTCAFTAIVLSLAKGTSTEISFEPCKMPVMTYVKYVGWQILYGIIVGLGCCLCVIPGIWLGARLATVSYYFIDNPEISFSDAISRGWHSTDGHALGIIGLSIVCFFIALAGLLLCCIGVYFTEVIAKFAFAILFLILSGYYNRPVADTFEGVETVKVEEIK